jgi:hypothetical protein
MMSNNQPLSWNSWLCGSLRRVLQSWRRKQHGSPKRWYPTTTLHAATTQKTTTCIFTAVGRAGLAKMHVTGLHSSSVSYCHNIWLDWGNSRHVRNILRFMQLGGDICAVALIVTWFPLKQPESAPPALLNATLVECMNISSGIVQAFADWLGRMESIVSECRCNGRSTW